MRLLPLVSLVCLTVSIGAVKHLSGASGIFKSPNFPEIYENNLSKKWGIQVRKGYKIKFKFRAFDLEDSYDAEQGGACIYDYVMITEAEQETFRFCGKARHHYDAPRINHWYHSKGNNITVTFKTDFSNAGISPIGFLAYYAESDIDECVEMERLKRTTLHGWDELVNCNHFCFNVLGSYYCDCRRGFELAPNNHTCVAKFCENQKLVARQGVVESPDYPYQYGKLSNCQWDINVSKGLSIQLTFDERFDIEEYYNGHNRSCAYDYLTIIHKDRSDRYCGTAAPNANNSGTWNNGTWRLDTRNARIQFHSDMSVEKIGFRIHYNTIKIRCREELQAPNNGSISSPRKDYYEFEDVIIFECDIGFDMIGHTRTECNFDGEWTHPVPKCKIISCGPPIYLISVRYSDILDLYGKTFEYSEKVTVECHKWYEQRTGYATWKCNYDKTWIPDPGSVSVGLQDIPMCRPICGKKGSEDNSAFRSQISGGTKSKPHEWPWSVFLNMGRRNLEANGRTCSGALISPSHILTAAHCVTKVDNAHQVHVWIGVADRTVNESEVKYAQGAEVIIHPKYDKKVISLGFDVAIIKLNETIIMSDTIRPVCLPSTLEDFTMAQSEHIGEVAAWGLYDLSGRVSLHLSQGKFPIVTNGHCLTTFKEKFMEKGRTLDPNIRITENMFCAGYEDNSKETCEGDSGAPFVMDNSTTSVYYEMGLVSFGLNFDCGEASYTVYTKLNQDIVRWIMQNTNNLTEE